MFNDINKRTEEKAICFSNFKFVDIVAEQTFFGQQPLF